MSAAALVFPKISLSVREAEVCLLLVEGLLLREIAFSLSISDYKVDRHRTGIYRRIADIQPERTLRTLRNSRTTPEPMAIPSKCESLSLSDTTPRAHQLSF
jgi:DNA-binding CsgD family transcriptional regulator